MIKLEEAIPESKGKKTDLTTHPEPKFKRNYTRIYTIV
jgi:hypothetical protein